MKTSSYFSTIKLNVLTFIAFVFFFNIICKAQTDSFTYKSVPTAYLPSVSDLASYHAAANIAKNGAYDLTESLPQGFVKDGSVDYTNYLQLAINNNKKVIFPNFPVLIKGLSLVSNSTLIFQPKSVLVMKPTVAVYYEVLQLNKLQNVNIYFPVIEGDRNKHMGKTGEWGMGISITGSSNIKIANPKINDCWGDGIYIGMMIQPSVNIEIYYPVLDNNRRNGISIVSVDGLNITHPVVSNTNGTPPGAAIDFEPNSNTDIINNINIDRPITFNSKFGIIMALTQLPGAIQKEVNINIYNHSDEGSYYGFCYAGFKDSYNGNPLTGNIKVLNPAWKNNSKSLVYAGLYKYGPNVEFKNASMPKKNNQDVDKDDPVKIKGYFMNLNKTNTNRIIFH